MRGETVAAVVADFLEKHSRAKGRRSADEVERLFEKHVLPAWGRRQIGDISRKDVVARLSEIASETPVQANRVLANVRKMFNWAIGQDIVQANPAYRVPAPGKETSRDRVLNSSEIKAFWEAAGSLGYPFAPVLRLLLLTAQRREEVGGMRNGELDFDRGIWVVPRERAKNGIANLVPLTSAVAGILKGLPRKPGKAGYVFTTTGKTSVSGWTKAKARLDAAMAASLRKNGILAEGEEVEHWVLHDLRRTATTLMARCKVAPHVIEAVINHKSGKVSGVAAVYNVYEYEEEKRSALEVLSGEVERVAGGAL